MVAVAVSLVLPLVPYGRTLLYPFSLLATWAHEMGHGLAAELTGGRFDKLVLLRSTGGYALVGFESRFDSVVISTTGLLGPAIAGAAMIWLAARPRPSKWALAVLSVAVLLSVVFYVRGTFGFFAMLAIGLVLAGIAFFAPDMVRIVVAGFIGVQFCLASWADRHYMFTKNFERDGLTRNSDTQNIAENLLLPYWFWGALILATSILIMSFSFWRAWIRPLVVAEKLTATNPEAI